MSFSLQKPKHQIKRETEQQVQIKMEEDSPSPTRRHPHHLSSLVVRPTDSGGGGSDYEPGEVRRDPPSYSRSSHYNDSAGHPMRADSVSPLLRDRKVDDRYRSEFDRSDFDKSSGPHGMNSRAISPFRQRKVDDRYRPDFDNSISPQVMHAGSVSPLRHRKVDDRYRSDFDHPVSPRAMHGGSISPLRHRRVNDRYRSDFESGSGPQRGRGFGGGRAPGRFRDYSPPYGRGRGIGRPSGRDFDMHASFRNDGMLRRNPNVAPREGDWICPDPTCNNLNFARRDSCNKCDKPRYFGPDGSPRRSYLSPPPRFSGPALVRSPVRGGLNGYRSPPRGGWGRDGPREIRAGPPHIRQGGRFPEQNVRRERPDYAEEGYRERERFDRAVPPNWGPRDQPGRDNGFNGRRGYDSRNGRRPLSPPTPLPPPPPRDRWAREARERSRSPMMGGPHKDHPRSSFMVNRGRGPRWGMPRGRFDDQSY